MKDAVADRFRESTGNRPSVDTEHPDIRINVHMKKDLAQVSLDLSGESLHRRFYRTEGGVAPLKENLAAALLLRAHWPQLARKGAPLVDPLCGSGTLLIEGAFMAMDRAPGLLRKSFGFSKWKQHDPALWQRLLKDAEERFQKGVQKVSQRFFGFDRDPEIIAQARSNAFRAGIGDFVSFRVQDINALTTPETTSPGLLITNPPYGERMGKKNEPRKPLRNTGGSTEEALSRLVGKRFLPHPLIWPKKWVFAPENNTIFLMAPSPANCSILMFRKSGPCMTYNQVAHSQGTGKRLI